LYVDIFSIEAATSLFLGSAAEGLGYSTLGSLTSFFAGASETTLAGIYSSGFFSSSLTDFSLISLAFEAAVFCCSLNTFHLSSKSGLWGNLLKCYS